MIRRQAKALAALIGSLTPASVIAGAESYLGLDVPQWAAVAAVGALGYVATWLAPANGPELTDCPDEK